MIVQQSAELTDKIVLWNKAIEESKNATAYQDRCEKLVALADRLALAFNTYQLLATSGIESFDANLSYMQDVKTYVEQMREQFRKQTNWGTESHVLTELQRKAQHLIDSLNKQAFMAWSRYIDNNRPPIQMNLLSTLQNIHGFKENASQIVKLIENMEQLKNDLPKSQATIESVQIISRLIMQAWTTIGAEDIPEEVLIFLKQAASPGGVTLEAFNESIREWLVQHRLTAHFSIHTLSQ